MDTARRKKWQGQPE